MRDTVEKAAEKMPYVERLFESKLTQICDALCVDGYSHEEVERIRPLLENLVCAAIVADRAEREKWIPVNEAPKDGTAVLLLMKTDDVFDRANHLSGIQFVGKNFGDNMEWCFAAPVGYGGIPDEWIEGWQPLPTPPTEPKDGE